MRIIILVAAMLISMNVYSQEYIWTGGLRLGKPMGVAVKGMLDYRSGVEGVIGTDFNNTIILTGLYEFHGYIKRRVNWYAGAGTSVIVATNEDGTNGWSGDLVGGIEYNFLNLPMVISLDWKPVYSITEKKPLFDQFGVSLRYVIQK